MAQSIVRRFRTLRVFLMIIPLFCLRTCQGDLASVSGAILAVLMITYIIINFKPLTQDAIMRCSCHKGTACCCSAFSSWSVGSQRRSLAPPVRFTTTDGGLLAGGAVTGFLSGVAGSAGLLGAAIFLGLDLPAAAYVASEAVTTSAMHLTKMVVYQRYALIGLRELQYGLFLGSAMILGSWTGKRIIERLPKTTFRRVVEALLVLSALQLIVFA
jgi:hypothetical protein